MGASTGEVFRLREWFLDVLPPAGQAAVGTNQEKFLSGILAALDPVVPPKVDRGAGESSSRQPAKPVEETASSGPRVFTYEIREGDTLWTLAARFGTDVQTLMNINGLSNPRRLFLGQKIRILTVPGLLHTVRRGETVEAIARKYRVSTTVILAANGLVNPNRLEVGQELILPGAVPPPPPPPPPRASPTRSVRQPAANTSAGKVDSPAAAAESGRPGNERPATLREPAARGGWPAFIWPVDGPISSAFGPRWGTVHEGIDIAVPTGTPVRAAAGGRVKFAGRYGAYGLLVIVDHGGGITTRYAHNSRLLVEVGDEISRGEVIAISGDTGRSTGPHLHFEIRKDGRALDPLPYLP